MSRSFSQNKLLAFAGRLLSLPAIVIYLSALGPIFVAIKFLRGAFSFPHTKMGFAVSTLLGLIYTRLCLRALLWSVASPSRRRLKRSQYVRSLKRLEWQARRIAMARCIGPGIILVVAAWYCRTISLIQVSKNISGTTIISVMAGIYCLGWIILCVGSRRYWMDARGFKGQIEYTIRAAETSSAEADAIIHRHQETGAPFALYLRSFESKNEVTSELVQAFVGQGEPFTGTGLKMDQYPFTMHFDMSFYFELKLNNALAKHIPIIGIRDPLSAAVCYALPMKDYNTAFWKPFIYILIRDATLVIANVNDLSSGFYDELQMAAHPSVCDKVIVIVRDPSAFLHSDKLVQRKRHLEPNKATFSFSRIIYEDEIDWDKLNSIPQFSDLISEVNYFASLDEDQKKRRRAALTSQVEAEELMRQGQWPEAERLLEKTMAIFFEVNDRYKYAYSTACLGSVRASMGNLDGALDVYQKTVQASRKNGHDRLLADALVSISNIHSAQNRTDQTLANLLEARAIAMAKGSNARRVLVYELLARVYFHRLEFSLAVDELRAALELCRAAGGFSAQCDLLAAVVAYLYISHQYEAAEPYLREALKLRQHSATRNGNLIILILAVVVLSKIGKRVEAEIYHNEALICYKDIGELEELNIISKLSKEILDLWRQENFAEDHGGLGS